MKLIRCMNLNCKTITLSQIYGLSLSAMEASSRLFLIPPTPQACEGQENKNLLISRGLASQCHEII